ncbi:MAG: SpoIIE family protein phosphatase [Flavobacteriales bacterium]|nr:SpoIIE family protein phosphatase [Flavobacteriales bacterium]
MLKKSTLIYFFTLLCLWGSSQSYKFKKFQEQDGLNSRFVYTLDQDENGQLLIGTGDGLFIYDGFHFTDMTKESGLSENFLTCSYRAQDGAIWYGHNKGLISRFFLGKFEHFDLSSYTTSKINQVFQDNTGMLWALTQNNGVLKKDLNNNWQQYISGLEDYTLYSIHVDGQNRIWIGTDMGLMMAKLDGNDNPVFDFVTEIFETKVSDIIASENALIIGTEDAGLFQIELHQNDFQVRELIHAGTDMKKITINSIFKDSESNLWVCSNNKGLFQFTGLIENRFLRKIEFQGSDELKTTSIRICREDREGNIWIGTMGDGLLQLTDSYFSILTLHQDKAHPEVFSIHEKNDTLWTGGFGRINVSYGELVNVIDSLDLSSGLPPSEITTIYQSPQNTLWAGTASGILLKKMPQSRKFVQVKLTSEFQGQRINQILGVQNKIYIATDYGIFVFADDKLVSHLSILSGLAHNVVKSLYPDRKGRIWIASSNSEITFIQDGEIHNIPSLLDGAMIQIRCFAEDNEGNMWIGTDGLGLMKIVGDSVNIITKASGLYSDYCYSMTCDQRNKLWVGHRGALSRINVLDNTVEIFDPGDGYDIEFIENAINRTPSGIVYFGINEGILRYEPDKDRKNEAEPILRMLGIHINDSSYQFSDQIILPYGEYKLTFNFIGLSLKAPDDVTYQYYLEGYETNWCSPVKNSQHDYNKIGPGDYYFKVKCFNADGHGGETIVIVRIFIDKPFWLKWWFIALCLLAIAGLVRFIIIRRERKLREDQEKLQSALDERTKEVVEQKELLEEKNKDITDSITYARNIQKAMLPAVDALKLYFNDAFVYYKPRDIVSGDFYWVERFNDTIVVSCADCTGHGVPGAFMSLIGTTLLKEVSSKKVVQSSRDVLVHLDSELNRMLNKQEGMSVEDGMDITVFDFHMDTGILNIASANRPVIFYHKGQWIEIKGDRQSIGGSRGEKDKDFTLYDFRIQKGDKIYMFSDGITDQFGGTDGKKLKRSGFANWIQESGHLSMSDQRAYLREKFHEWKGDHDQLDDIIVIGIEF